ncbi:MAG: outer membrane receptor protein involved in Fe transport [Flavobacteriales bacterium]|jgi:outer membrane receptor protein involved in Fe transport
MRLYKILFAALLVLFFTINGSLIAQSDSLNLDLSKLDWNDLKSTVDLSVGTKVISGSRSERDIADLPFTVYVITGKEIRENGYLTLTDVLKRLPGIRVSQPGSAIHGETFLMRGLLGNAYTKILINDVPIKPYVTSGMPIGAQLPIRNAERIEVIYGPAATLYGADASAGVINIILKKTDRPIYVQADLGFGSEGMEDLNVMFSGKLGKGKRILKFSVFGSFTGFNDRRTKYYQDSLYSPLPYEKNLPTGFLTHKDSPNYRGSSDITLLGKLPHQSRALGVDLHFKKFNLYYHRFYRRDHSALGLNPLAVSYANPLNLFGETITSGGLSYTLNKKKFRFKASLSSLDYKTDPASSFTFVFPLLSLIQHSFIEGETPEEVQSAKQEIHNNYYSGSRYSVASSIEGNLDFLFGYKFNKYFELAWGSSLQGGIGKPLRNFLKQPNNITTEQDRLQGFFVEDNDFTNITGFVETYLNTQKWNIILGIQAFKRTTNTVSSSRFLLNPRIGIQYHLKENLRFRFSAGKAYRYPSPFYSASTYTIDTLDFFNVTTGSQLEPEETISSDIGLRWFPRKNINFDLAFYYSKTSNFIRYGILDNVVQKGFAKIGYTNDSAAEAQLYGVQSSLILKDIIPAIGMSLTFNLNYSIGREVANSVSFTGDLIKPVNLNGLRSLPKIISQIDIKLKPSDKITILLENTYMTQSLTQNFITLQEEGIFNELDKTNAGFYTLDFMFSYKLNKHISALVKVNNLFNTKYAGIDATEDIDALIFNPQSLRISRIGVNYRID